MAEPVTIGGQTFIKTGDGWVDQKSKAKAPEGLLSLLNRLQVENSAEGKKKRVRIDTSRPIVKLGKTEYVWDLNSGVWIDKKTKDAANPAFSKLIEAAYQSILQGTTEEEKLYESWAKQAAAGQVFAGMGATGEAAKQKVRTRTGSGQLPAPNIKINSPIVQMIEKLATIDGYLKQRLDNQKKIAANNNAMIREASIEAAGQLDAEPVIDEEKIKEEAEKENEKSNGAILAVAAIAAAALVSQLEPVKEAFSSVVDFAKTVYGYFKDFTNVTNTALESINSMFGDSPTKENKSSAGSSSVPAATSPVSPDASPASTPTAAPTIAPNSGSNVSAPSPTPNSSSETTPKPATPTSAPKPTTPAMATPTSTPKPATPTSTPKPTTPAMATPTSTPKPATPTSTPKPAASTSTSKPATPAMATPTSTPKPAASTSTSKPATPAITKPNDPFAAYTGSAGKLSNDPVVRDKAFSTAPKKGAAPDAISEIPKNDIVGLGNYLIGKGADRSKMQHSAFGAVGEHSKNSRHYRNMAIDVNFPTNEAAMLDALEPQLRAAGYNTIWRKKGHLTHMHVSVGGPEGGGSGDSSEDGFFQQAATAGVELTKGAMEAIGNILKAGLGPMTATSGSQLSTVNDTMSGNIARASRERMATVAATKTPKPVAVTKSDPVNMNAPSSSSTIQNMPTASDKAGVEFYLTRMGFPKIIYTQTSRGATLR